LGVFEIDRKVGGVTLVELAAGVTVDEVQAKSEAVIKHKMPVHV
ncbi:MAG TPA: hypothetical protein VGI79_21015, partial [Caulobacteraceae bacterium]